MADGSSDDEVRVGHPERERAIGLLNDAFAAGYLEIAEFEERSGAVYGGRTRGDLRAVLADLPNAALLFPDVPVAAPVAAAPAEWDIGMDTLRRRGGWQVPPAALITGSWGTLDLDFTDAVFTTPSVDLQLQLSTCTIKLRLGPDQEIRYPKLTRTGWSSIKDKAGAPPRPGGPVITVSGAISGWSGMVVRRS